MTKPVLYLPENTKGRDFVVADIHGIYDVLEQALIDLAFDPAVDRLIAIGDLINRGPESARCLEFLEKPWFFALRGNHEEMFLKYCHPGKMDLVAVFANAQNGFGWVLDQDEDTIRRIRAVFEKLPTAIEIQTKEGIYGFVHADIPKGMDWPTFIDKIEARDPQTTRTALWSHERFNNNDNEGVKGVLRVFFGHTPSGQGVKELGNCLFMDTGGVFRVLKQKGSEKYYLTVCDIRANAVDILAPQQDKDKLFKTARQRPKPPGA